ncbi:MAG: RHS repeat-associated core domain-containing protein [Ignavibacteriales bacterium]|nr:RHS repeat-associated core domain-containing protein [Ignavibacteriales bacterium]
MHFFGNRVTIDTTGTVLNAQDYYAFGEILRSYNNSSPNERYDYTGKERDTESGLNYFGARYYDSEIGRWLNVDPLADKYPGWSPYNYCMNNPVNSVDPDGRKVVDSKNKEISIVRQKDGTLKFGKNATSAVKRICNALAMTKTGGLMLDQVVKSKIKVHLDISDKTVIRKEGDKTIFRLGETIQGNFNPKDNYGQFQNTNGSIGIKEASITINEGSINTFMEKSSKAAGLTVDQVIGAVAGHEIVHATDESEINKDKQTQLKGEERKDGEVKPKKVENKIMDELKEN